MKEKKKGMRKKRGEREKKKFCVCVWRLGASRQVDLPQILYKSILKYSYI